MKKAFTVCIITLVLSCPSHLKKKFSEETAKEDIEALKT